MASLLGKTGVQKRARVICVHCTEQELSWLTSVSDFIKNNGGGLQMRYSSK